MQEEADFAISSRPAARRLRSAAITGVGAGYTAALSGRNLRRVGRGSSSLDENAARMDDKVITALKDISESAAQNSARRPSSATGNSAPVGWLTSEMTRRRPVAAAVRGGRTARRPARSLPREELGHERHRADPPPMLMHAAAAVQRWQRHRRCRLLHRRRAQGSIAEERDITQRPSRLPRELRRGSAVMATSGRPKTTARRLAEEQDCAPTLRCRCSR